MFITGQFGIKLTILLEGKKSHCFYNDYYYLRRNFDLESSIIHHVKRLYSAKPKLSFVPTSNAPFYPAQKEALEKAFSNGILLISGGPGSGKTYLANVLIDSLLAHKADASILFTAPTGKAAFRIKHPKITQGTIHNLIRS